MSLKEEIANRIKLSHTHPNLSLSYMEDADYILKLFEKRIDEMMITQLSTNDEIAENIHHNEVLEKVKEMLK